MISSQYCLVCRCSGCVNHLELTVSELRESVLYVKSAQLPKPNSSGTHILSSFYPSQTQHHFHLSFPSICRSSSCPCPRLTVLQVPLTCHTPRCAILTSSPVLPTQARTASVTLICPRLYRHAFAPRLSPSLHTSPEFLLPELLHSELCSTDSQCVETVMVVAAISLHHLEWSKSLYEKVIYWMKLYNLFPEFDKDQAIISNDRPQAIVLQSLFGKCPLRQNCNVMTELA